MISKKQYEDVSKIMSMIEDQQKILNELRSKASRLSQELGLEVGHSQNWASAVAFIKGWVKGFEKGDSL